MTSDACKANSGNLSDESDNVSIGSSSLAVPPTAGSTPKSADVKSVNLMEFSPMTSKASSSQNVTADTFPKENLTPTEAPNEKWTTLSDSSFVACDITLYVSPDDFYINLHSDE